MLNIFSRKLFKLTTSRIILLSYLGVIIVGTILLSFPAATSQPGQASFLEAFFTATSAVCVTGLIIVNTAVYWSTLGQIIIIILIQIGGLGLMTFSTMGFILLGKRITLKRRQLLKEDIGNYNYSGMIQLVKYIVIITLGIEAVGALLLFLNFNFYMPAKKAIWNGIFHAISAFNNAGFDIFGNSLENFTRDPGINLTVISLIILGGIGFTVIKELWENKNKSGNSFKLSLHSKIVIVITLILLLAGTIAIFIFEKDNPETIGKFKIPHKLLSSFFLSVTSRTAGFNTVPTGFLEGNSLFFIILLMFIGASPCSTGGGIKTTTLGAILTKVYATLKGKKDFTIFNRRLNKNIVDKATTIMIVALGLNFLIILILTVTEPFSFMDILFETFSAFGTVGLSTGITGDLSNIGQIMIIITMLAGRVGPLTLVISLGRSPSHPQNYHYPKEDIMLG